ncbi:MAG: hypothetical protein IPO26_18890 [Saprospiraceae bacterium]|nr:hypothetical protein [Saprospiraceae bacterium]
MDNEFLKTSEKISNFVDFLLNEEGYEGWELGSFELTKIVNDDEIRKVCKWKIIDGELKLVCD